MILSCGCKLYGSQNEERGIRKEKACHASQGRKLLKNQHLIISDLYCMGTYSVGTD